MFCDIIHLPEVGSAPRNGEMRVNLTAALVNALRYRNAKAQIAIMAAALLVATGLIGYYAEMFGSFVNNHRDAATPVVIPSAALGAVAIAVAMVLWLFILVPFSDLLLEAAAVDEPTRNRYLERVHQKIMTWLIVVALAMLVVIGVVDAILFIHN
jgi:hypothetical protein